MNGLNTVNNRIKAERDAEEAAIAAAIEQGKCQKYKFADKAATTKAGRVSIHFERADDDDRSRSIVDKINTVTKGGIVFRKLFPDEAWKVR